MVEINIESIDVVKYEKLTWELKGMSSELLPYTHRAYGAEAVVPLLQVRNKLARELAQHLEHMRLKYVPVAMQTDKWRFRIDVPQAQIIIEEVEQA